MKTQIDIITGFLGSGKTTFIHNILEKENISTEQIIIIQCEIGETEIESNLLSEKKICVKSVAKDHSLDENYIKNIVNEYQPDRIIIEHNGTDSLEKLLNVLYTRSMQKICVIDKIVHIIDAVTFDIFMNNMGEILIEQISYSDYVIVNNTEILAKHKINNMEKTLKAINRSVKIVIKTDNDDDEIAVDSVYLSGAVKKKKPSDMITVAFFVLVMGYIAFSIFRLADIGSVKIDLSKLQVFNTVFLSILIQAFPFILLGVIVSSIIQVFVPGETIVRLFPKKTGLGFIVAILAGFLFPVCDCAIVPIAARLVKKGVPLHTAVTFMLAAPIVNPLSIASTLYAFPGEPSIAIYRLILGIAVAFAVGITFCFFPEEKNVTLDRLDYISCRCGYCGDNAVPEGFFGRLEAIFRHAGTEFFEVGRFLVIGAFLSSIVQVWVPKDILSGVGGGYIVSLVIMMLSAFVLSVCSTSDAFIARTFVNQFSIGAVMGFMVLGPMIDIKNVLMLLGNFNKRFVIKLIFVIFTLAFIILLFLTTILSVILFGG
jgi:uncharacterized membrane protein YraQ (UPF0718 family)